jgi:aquaporin Z
MINLRNYLTELLGAFFLVFVIGMVSIDPSSVYFIPFIIGLTLSVIIFIGGHISGGYYNPAVTVAVLLQNDLSGLQAIGYIISQLIGACLGGMLAVLLKDASAISLDIPLGDAFMVEFIFTFLLVFAVLCFAMFPKAISGLLTGITVGIIIIIGGFTVGNISGASFNPAVVIGALVLGVYEFQDIVGILIAIFLGGCFAAFVFSRIKSTLPNFESFIQNVTAKRSATSQTFESDTKEKGAEEPNVTQRRGGSIRFTAHKQAGIMRTNDGG